MIAGHDRPLAMFKAAWASGSLHHAWLLAGPRGVGKASFAEAAAKRVLAETAGPPIDLPGIEVPADHPMARLIDAGSHPDFRRLERLENKSQTGLARNISVEQVRSLAHLFATAPAMSPWRVVIIDAADDLERSAANALLKMVEEPPANCLFFLVSHVPGRLLPTIRSRCRRLDFMPLTDAAMTALLETKLPQLAETERRRLVILAGGSPGRALAYAELDLGPVEEEARAIMREGDPDNMRRSKLAQSLAGKAAADRYAAFLEIVPAMIAREARLLAGGARERALDAYERARETAALAPRVSLDPAATTFRLGTILASVHGEP